jgi:hypothetical protein
LRPYRTRHELYPRRGGESGIAATKRTSTTETRRKAKSKSKLESTEAEEATEKIKSLWGSRGFSLSSVRNFWWILARWPALQGDSLSNCKTNLSPAKPPGPKENGPFYFECGQRIPGVSAMLMLEISMGRKDFRPTQSFSVWLRQSRTGTIFQSRSYADTEILAAPRLSGLRHLRVLPLCLRLCFPQCLRGSLVNILLIAAAPRCASATNSLPNTYRFACTSGR